MLRKEPSQRPASAVELRREIEQCLDDVERREALAARMARPLNVGRQWLTAAPRSRRAVICSVSVIGLMLAFGYGGNKASSPRSVPVPAQDGWSYLGTWNEPFPSLALARRVSFDETAASPRVIGPKGWLPEDSTWQTEIVKPFGLRDDSRSGEEGPFPTAIALDEPFSVNDSENEKVGIKSMSNRDKDEVKKTAKRSVKRPQQRVTSRDRDRGFNPLREIQRAREKIRREIRRIL
jgi:hypothetical protein